MTLKERNDLLVRLHYLIKRKATGTSEELSKRLEISTPTVFRYLDTLREYGAPLAYCRLRCSYYYEHEYELRFF